MPARTLILGLVAACNAVEPLDLPADPAESGVPVGVMTLTTPGGDPVELWYPAGDSAAGQPTDAIDHRQFVSDVVAEAIGDFEVTLIPTIAVRDAAVRNTGEPLPVVVFSHGFGGTRLQSPTLATHLASRGYVVAATDHDGRSLQDLVPCLFSPPLEGCNLAFGGEDAAPGEIDDLLALLASENDQRKGPFEDRLDLDQLGLMGHSAGGSTTVRLGSEDTRFDALLPMAAPGPVTRDVPTLRLAGTCDQAIPIEDVQQGHAEGYGDLVTLAGAGHLAFSDLCTLNLGDFAATYLEGRDDVSALFLSSLVALAIDGCPGIVPSTPGPDCPEAFLPLEQSEPPILHYAAVFFDAHLRGEGPGVQPDRYAGATLFPGDADRR